MKTGSKMWTVNQFLGLNEAADGYTEIRMGEASQMENFFITDDLNLTLRPGVRRVGYMADRTPAPILASWAGFVSQDSTRESLVLVDFLNGKDRIFLYAQEDNGGFLLARSQEGALGLTSVDDPLVKIFAFAGALYIMSRCNTVCFRGGSFVEEKPYIPLVIAGAAPSGGGTTLENINLLTSLRRITYSADGEALAYVLPEESTAVVSIAIDNVSQDVEAVGAFEQGAHTFRFQAAPTKGVGNVEFTYDTSHETTEKTRLQILSQPLAEAYNGSTDTRLFVGGNGNVCYYTGVPMSGAVTPMYFPALYEVAVDMTGASVTGLVRHYGKLLIFTRDGTYTLVYEPVTLPGGDTTAGFYLRAANREFGNDCLGQVQTVNNYPRTVTKKGIYEWRITSGTYQDERYAQRVSDKVQRSLRDADVSRIVTCDDSFAKTYYVFLNDNSGTVLVNRYGIGKENLWCIYRGEIFKNVTNAFLLGTEVTFCNKEEAFSLLPGASKDVSPASGGTPTQIKAIWKSGYMDFGADFQRKYARQLFISLLPKAGSELTITAETDRRSEYTEKTVSNNILDFSNLNFSRFTFNTNNTPRIQQVRLKVKKFVYYRLVFRVEADGATATVLSWDMEVQYGAKAK